MSTNTKVNVELVSVNTKKTQNEFKNLKTRIKELRLEIENLDETSAEYQAKITELGNLMHQNAEIQEQAKLASQDYGDTLSSVTKASAGLVASISAVNGVMNLMGANTEETQKAMLKVQSLMAIVQAMSSLDTAEKSFQALWTKIKAVTQARKENAIETQKDTLEQQKNTNAVNTNANALDNQSKTLSKGTSGIKLFGNGIKNLGKSLKAFALSNPFTLIITAITTAITLVSQFIEKAKQAQLEAERATTANMKKLYGSPTSYDDIYIEDEWATEKLARQKRAVEFYKELVDEAIKNGKVIDGMVGQREKIDVSTIKQAKEAYKALQIEVELLQHEYSFLTKTERDSEEGLKKRKEIAEKYIEMYEAEMELNQQNLVLETNRLLTYDKESEIYAEVLEQVNFLKDNLDKVYTNTLNKYNEIDRIDEQTKAKEKQKQEKAVQEREKAQAKELNDLKDWLALEQKQLEVSYNKREITEKDYYDKSIKLYEQYENKLNNIKNNPNVSKIDLLSAKGSTLDAEKKLAEYELQLIKQRVIVAEQADILVIDEQKKLQHDIDNYTKQISENNAKILELSNKHWLQQYTILQQQNNLTEQEQINHLDNLTNIELQYLEEQQNVLSGNFERDKNISEETYQRDLDALKFQLDKLLITQEQYDYELKQLEIQHKNDLLNIENEYNLSLIDIQAQRNEIELEYSNQRYEIARNEAERKIALNDTYFNSFQSIQSQLSSFLSEYQNSMDSNSEKYKELQRLQIIMDSASGSYSAFVSAFKSGVPFPYNVVMGGLASSLVIGQGVLALNNLNNNKIGTTNAVSNLGSSSVYETLSYQQLGNIESTIRDSKVYVLESDITGTARRVSVSEQEATF